MKEHDTNEDNPCPCYKKTCTNCPKGFEKIVDFKNAGLVIYRHSVKPEKINQIIGIAGSEIDESGFIFHNTADENIASRDFLPQIEQWAVQCVRCRQVMKHAINILQKVSAISKNEIIGICEHCRLKEQPCGECEGALKTFLETKKKAKEIGFAKERVKEWLKKVQSEFKDNFENEKETGKESLKKYIQKFKDTSKLKLRAHSEVRIDQLCRRGHDKSERKLDIRELCRQSGRDLRKPSPFITEKSKIKIPFNFDDELGVVDSSSLTSLDRKIKSAVPKFEQPSNWNKDQITIISKKDRVSKKGDRFIEEKHLILPDTQGRDNNEDDILPNNYHTQYAHDTEKESSSIEQPTDEKLQTGFFFSFPIEKRKEEKLKQQKSSSELIGDIYDRIRENKEEIRRKQEAARLKKVEEEEKKQRARQEKIKLVEEKQRLEEEKRKLDEGKITDKKKLKYFKDFGMLNKSEGSLKDKISSTTAQKMRQSRSDASQKELGLKSKSQISKSGSKKSKMTMKESKGKLKSNPEKSVKGQKSDLTSSKTELKKIKDESESKQKNRSKYSEAELESKTEAQTVLKDYKAEAKIESKEHKSGPKADSKESETKTKAELKDDKSGPNSDSKEPKTKTKDELKQAKAETKAESKLRDSESKSKESKEAETKEPNELKSVSKESKAESKDTKAELKEPKAESKEYKAGSKYPKSESKDVKNKSGPKSSTDLKESKDISNAKKSPEKSDREKGKKEIDNIHSLELNLSKMKMDSDKAKPENFLSTIHKDIKKRSSGEPRVPRRQVEAQLKAAQEERERKARKELKVTKIDMLKDSQDLMILGLVKVKDGGKQMVTPSQVHLHVKDHKFIKGHSCPLCMNSDLDLEYESRRKHGIEQPEMISGCKIIHTYSYAKEKEDSGVKPILFQYKCDDSKQPLTHIVKENSEENKPTKISPEEDTKGVIRYALSDRTFIEKGWTMLPTEKVVRKMNVYHMRPAHPEFDWFARNRNKRLMTYDSGERFAEFDDDGHGRWFYKNQRLALQYYDAEELNAQQRYVIYSNGEPDERGRTRPYTVLAMFDYLGNGVVFDHSGKIRMKYNQTEGVVLDKSIGPVSHWQWHTLNDPPVLQQVMIDTHMAHKDPDIIKLTTPHAMKQPRPDNEDMLAIEFDNFVKEKSKKLTQKFKPFQIRMKALKINEHFSLKVLDQANVYLIYRDGTTNIKLNLGMLLDHKEIVDTDTAELGEVASNMERLPARTDSLAAMQRSVEYAQHFEKTRTKRELILRPPEPSASADQLAAAASRPMRLPLRPAHSSTATKSSCYKSMKPSNNLYYDNRLF